MFGFTKYNYESFSRNILAKEMAETKLLGGPKPGDRAPDFEAETLDGDTIRLSDYRGEKNVVLTFGSATCPMTAGSIGGMNDLYDEYNGHDVKFLFVYVREAHPGEEIPAHESMDDKICAAERLRDEEEIEMPILVDDLRGSIHRKYGRLPNPTYIIDKSGRVAFRALWTRPDRVEEALEELLERQRDRGVEHVVVDGGEDRSMPVSYAFIHSRRALERGGDKAVRDFTDAIGLPGRIAYVASRVVEPVALNPGKALAAAGIAGAVIAGSLLAGRELRKRRLRSRPYNVYKTPPRGHMTGTDYEAVGI
jgi:peroxiredoxin